jgi:hypothetical protein
MADADSQPQPLQNEELSARSHPLLEWATAHSKPQSKHTLYLRGTGNLTKQQLNPPHRCI